MDFISIIPNMYDNTSQFGAQIDVIVRKSDDFPDRAQEKIEYDWDQAYE